MSYRPEPRMVTDDEIESFRRDGFVAIEGLVPLDRLARFGDIVDRAVDDRTRHDDRPLGDRSLYEQSFDQCMNLWETHRDLRPFTFDQGIAAAAAALLGADTLRIWHDQALYKRPGGRITDAHQDLPFWPISPAEQITAWIPFDGTDDRSGAMSYLPGSHAIGLRRFVDITHRSEPYDVLSDAAVEGIDEVLIEAPPGSVVFHHSLTVHRAHPNLTDRTRRVYCVIMFADGCVRSKPWPHMCVERQQIDIGAPIVGDVTPILYPMADGCVPPTPSAGEPPTTGYGRAADTER